MTNKTKVCHLTSPHPRFDTRIFIKECVSLAESGFDVHLIVADGEKDDNVQGVQIHGIDRPAGKIARLFNTTGKIFQKAKEIDADIYQFHDPELMWVGIKLTRLGKKVVYDVHEDLPRQRFVKKIGTPVFRPLLEMLLEKIEHYAASKYAAVFTSTPFIRERFKPHAKRLDTLCNFPMLKEFKSEFIPWDQKKDAAAYIGDLILERGVYQMVEAVDSLKLDLHICGRFSDSNLKAGVTTLKGWSNVRYHGYVSRDFVAETLSISKMGLVTLLPHSNFIHSYPIKMFEYMAAAIPVIASNFPLFVEIIEGNNCGICVDPENPDAIREAMKFILDNPEKAYEMGQNGRIAVLEKYNWGTEKDKLVHTYRELETNYK